MLRNAHDDKAWEWDWPEVLVNRVLGRIEPQNVPPQWWEKGVWSAETRKLGRQEELVEAGRSQLASGRRWLLIARIKGETVRARGP